ncbi:hypothetical protein [Burkholderia vietnamiensis]|uniref:hypothetical protein n=1 Tax=Burkholderia vietnamiensis TaxID=60552 RepID=UPI001CAF6EC6|nr:hypothetical protein [Burkholderia vietnamiensis]CAG9228805.1 putative DNA-binding protein [Burkholderia vietnamiensis]
MAEQKTPGAKRGTKALTEKQRAELIALWRSGDATLEELGKRFNRTPRALSMMFAKEGVKKGEKRAEVHAAVQQKVAEQIAGDATVIAGKIRETKDSHYAASKVIAQLIQNQLVKAQRDQVPFATVQAEIKTLKLAAEALSVCREERFIVLGIANGEKEEDDDLPELPIHEMTAAQILDMQQRQEDGGLDVADDAMTVDFEDVQAGVPDAGA